MIKGLEDMSRKLDRLARNAKNLGGTRTVPLGDLFTPNFMEKNTHHPTLDAFLAAAGMQDISQEDFEALPEETMDHVVRTHSSFHAWKEMMEAAAAECVNQKLFAGVRRL